MGDAQLGAERQRTVSRGHGILVEALARRSPAAGLVAIIGGHAGEAAARARRRRHRRVGVAPIGGRVGIALGVVAVMMVRVPVVMPGFGRSFGGGSTDEESGGNESDRRARPGHGAQRLQRQHLVVPNLVLPHMWQVEPP